MRQLFSEGHVKTALPGPDPHRHDDRMGIFVRGLIVPIGDSLSNEPGFA